MKLTITEYQILIKLLQTKMDELQDRKNSMEERWLDENEGEDEWQMKKELSARPQYSSCIAKLNQLEDLAVKMLKQEI